jgi:hypothetical protein
LQRRVRALERGIANEDDGIDLVELADAVAAEIEFRGYEDAEFKVARALVLGECRAVVRPDGQEGYAPVG